MASLGHNDLEYLSFFLRTLQWRHNEPHGVSNHQPYDCLLNRLFRLRSKKTSKLRATGLCEGNSPVTGEFPAQMASNGENVSIWWRHLESTLYEAWAKWPLENHLQNGVHFFSCPIMLIPIFCSMACCYTGTPSFSTSRPRQNGRHFPDDIFKSIFLNGNVWISNKISLKFVAEGPINNIPALVQIMAWRRPGDKPLSKSMMTSLLTHILGLNELNQWTPTSLNDRVAVDVIYLYSVF